MKTDCNVIRDLLPLYADEVCSKESRGLVDEHLAECPACTEELARIQSPTLVMAGDKDMIKDGHTRLIAQSIPGAELVIIPGTHFIASQNPGPFNEAVLRFLL